MNRILFFIDGLSILFTSACKREDSGNINQDSIYASYKLLYNASDNTTRARATLRISDDDGTKLEVKSPASITFENEKLSYDAILGYHEKNLDGLINNGTFVYTNIDNTTYSNTITFEPITLPEMNNVSKASNFTIVWEGSAVGDGEEVTVSINGQDGNEELSSSTVGTSEFVFSTSQLQQLGNGQAVIELKREFLQTTIEYGTSAGGRKAYEYITTKTITITD